MARSRAALGENFLALERSARKQNLTLLMPPVGRRLIEEAYEIHRSKGLEVRLLLTLALSAMQVTVRFSSANFPKWTIDGETTYPHLHNLGMELNAREIFFSPLH
ncbi:hypothetical protein TNCV_3866451 [Trichonephila clavipes]|nr:hypothetical protein TNCV_3866451 [Trichonephila clavipes]